MLRRSFLACLAVLSLQIAPALAQSDAALWERLKSGGHVVVARHAATLPGKGDPPNFKLGDCSTQRNLSEAGRADAGLVAAAFRQHAVPVGEVLSSRWCRCSDTAQLAFGRVDPVAMLDSSGADDEAARQRKLASLRAHIAGYKGSGNLVLVTHETNIRELTGQNLSQGELLVAAPQPDGSLTVLGRIGLQRSADAGQKM